MKKDKKEEIIEEEITHRDVIITTDKGDDVL